MVIAPSARFPYTAADRETLPARGARDLGERALWTQLCDEVKETHSLGQGVTPVITGPLTYLWLSQAIRPDFDQPDQLDLLECVLPIYGEFLCSLAAQGVEWVRIDESILSLELPLAWKSAFERAYHILQYSPLKKLVATAFNGLRDNLGLAANLPVQGLHIDAVQTPEQLGQVLDRLPIYKILSVGLVNGRSAWRCELEQAMTQLQAARERFGDNLWVSGSCLPPHCFVNPSHQDMLDPERNNLLAFELRKGGEIAVHQQAR